MDRSQSTDGATAGPAGSEAAPASDVARRRRRGQSAERPRRRDGIDLAYRGTPLVAADERERPGDAVDAMASLLGQIGYFVLKLNQMQVGRAHHLQVASEPPERHQPVTHVAHGDAPLIGSACADPSSARLLEIAQSIHGIGRYINARQQRSAPYNRDLQTGEITVLEVLHAALLGYAGELLRALGEQGFRYVAPGRRGSRRWLAAVRRMLAAGRYRIEQAGDAAHVTGEIAAGVAVRLPIFPFSPALRTRVDIARRATCRTDCIAVAPDGGDHHSIGFVLAPDGALLDHALVRSLFVLELLRRGGYHAYSPEERAKVQSKHFYFRKSSRLSENMVINGMLWVVRDLADRHGFDLTKSPAAALRRVHARLERPDLVEHLLLTAVASRMGAPLDFTQAQSARPPAPARYQIPLAEQLEVCRGFAHAFRLRRADGQEACPTAAGPLAPPLLADPRHAAALLAIGLIVVEQVLIEQAGLDWLSAGIPGLRELLSRAAQTVPAGRFGRQFPECGALLAELRALLEFDALIAWLDGAHEHQGLGRADGPAIRLALARLASLARRVDALTGAGVADGVALAARRLTRATPIDPPIAEDPLRFEQMKTLDRGV